jgi:hypothetical protein
MTHFQCKSRFATIKRRVQRQKNRKALPASFTLADYVIEEATRLLPTHSHFGPLLLCVRRMKEEESDFMRITRQLQELEISCAEEEKNNRILTFLHGKKMRGCEK